MQFFSSFPNTKCLCSISGRVEVPWSSGLRRLAGDARIGRSIPITAFMPLRKALYLHCSFIVHQINENVTGIWIPTYARVKKIWPFLLFLSVYNLHPYLLLFSLSRPPSPSNWNVLQMLLSFTLPHSIFCLSSSISFSHFIVQPFFYLAILFLLL